MSHPASPHVDSGLLLLADITGYTRFLDIVAEAHPDVASSGGPVPPAYELMVTLLDVVAERLQPLFTPVQTEGDAVFAFADADAVGGRGDEVLATVRATYEAFHAHGEEHRRIQDHECQACVLIGSLELKFVGHAGTFVVQRLPTRTHLAGPAVILAHRLLKNRVTDATNLRGCLLLTDAAVELLGLDASVGVSHSESGAADAPVTGRVMALEAASA